MAEEDRLRRYRRDFDVDEGAYDDDDGYGGDGNADDGDVVVPLPSILGVSRKDGEIDWLLEYDGAIRSVRWHDDGSGEEYWMLLSTGCGGRRHGENYYIKNV